MKARILVPIDFSDCTERVLDKATEVARELSADVLLMHSVQVPPALGSDVPVATEAERHRPALSLLTEEAQQQLTDFAETLLARGIDVVHTVTVGAPAKRILEVAQREGVARIVMGTRGKKGLAKLMLGSVAQTVQREASCPTVVVESVWSPKCKAGSCPWCASGRTKANQQLEAELDG